MKSRSSTLYYPAYQFAIFRVIFGLYLLIHFLYLIPVAGEIWSSSGLISDVRFNPTYGAFPNILYLFDSTLAVTLFVSMMTLLSFFVMIGFFRRTSALLLWYGWASLFHQNNLILNPGLPMVGWLLLALVLIPKGEGWGVEKEEESWAMPPVLYWGAWVIVGVAYTISGIDKAMAPSWIDGSAITHLLNNPLARDYFIRDLLLSTPELFRQILTWSALLLEIGFALLVIFSRTRMIAWFMIMTMHLGILMIVDFPDLTLGVMMIHLFTFDARWFQTEDTQRVIIFDGLCGFCNKSVDTLMRIDVQKKFHYTSLQGEFAKGLPLKPHVESIVFYENGTLYYRSTAILKILRSLGGIWIFTNLFYLIPRVIRDYIYDFIATYRYKIFGKMESCRMPKKGEQELFIA
jgi:predicted DCC family thiol-disulfide oxidoreductase YuxK